MNIVIRSIATANPPRYVTGQEVFDFFCGHFGLAPDERALYRRILVEGPIRGRYVGLDHDEQACQCTCDQMLARFGKYAAGLGHEAAAGALASAGRAAGEVSALVVNTCTGYLCPGLSSYVAQSLGLSDRVKAMDLAGMGCGAAIPNLECAAGLVARANGQGHGRCVVSVASEVCSATLFMGEQAELVVSNSIFGDGAAAAVVEGAADGDEWEGVARIVDFESALAPRYREQLRYRSENGRLRNVLGRRVPVIGARMIEMVVERLLGRNGLAKDDIKWWAVHPGGTAVLEQVAKRLKLEDGTLSASHEIFREYGNMSSPSVLFVLKRIVEQGRPQRGQRGLLLSFGAGFSAYGALLEF